MADLTMEERAIVIEANSLLPCIGPSWHEGNCLDHVGPDSELCCTGCRYRGIRADLIRAMDG